MRSNFQRLPAERARHKRRLPSEDNASPLARQVVTIDGITLSGPVTFTQTIVNNPTTTTSLPATTTSTTSALQTSSTTTSTSAIQSDTTITVSTAAATSAALTSAAPYTPSASAVNSASPTESAANSNTNATNGITGVSTQRNLPTGAIVGITLACVILVLGSLVLLIRQRAIRNRQQTTRQSMAAWTTARPMTMTQQPTPGVSFAQLQAAQANNNVIPQPMSSTYNNPIPPPALIPGGGAGAGGSASATVVYEFIPTLPDELSITTGETVRVVSEFDDGWALCRNARGEQGMVPLECLDRGSGAAPPQSPLVAENYRNSRRGSSLAVRN